MSDATHSSDAACNCGLASIIIPVYNTDASLFRRCVASITSQTYRNLEILIVDDGSADATARLCDELALSDGRIHVFHKPNGGVSTARNAGLANMKGEWVTFVDADDELVPYCIEHALSAAVQCEADIAFGRVAHVRGVRTEEVSPWYDDGKPFKFYSEPKDIAAIAKHILSSMDVKGANPPQRIQLGPCAKVFRAERIHRCSLDYPEDVFVSEDRIFNVEALCAARGVVCYDEVWYLINHHDDSTTRSFSVDDWIVGLRAVASKPVRPDLQNSLVVGCALQVMRGVEQVMEIEGPSAAWRFLQRVADDDLVGWKADIDLTDYDISRKRALVFSLSAKGRRRSVFLIISLNNIKKKLSKK